MIITCGRCAAQYQLDEAKVPDEGARVCCSQCEHSFVVESPSGSDARRTEQLARAAMENAAEVDFPSGSETEGEADWEFNDDGALDSEPEADSAPEATVMDLSDLEVAREAVDDILASAVPQELAEPDPLAEAMIGEAEPSAVVEEQKNDGIGDSEETPEIRSESVSAEISSEELAGELEAFDDLEGWDAFDTDTVTVPEEAVSGAESGAATLTEPQVGLSVVVAATGDSQRAQRGAQLVSIAGYAALALLLAVGLYGGLAPPSHAIASSRGSWSGAGFEVEDVEGRWVDNAVAGPTYVVDGQMRWAGNANSRRAPALGIRLLDAQGQVLDGQEYALGPAIPDRILRESDPFELAMQQRQRAASQAASAAVWQPFSVVAAGLPDAARRFELEATRGANADGANPPLP